MVFGTPEHVHHYVYWSGMPYWFLIWFDLYSALSGVSVPFGPSNGLALGVLLPFFLYGFVEEPKQRTANLSSSIISEQRDCCKDKEVRSK